MPPVMSSFSSLIIALQDTVTQPRKSAAETKRGAGVRQKREAGRWTDTNAEQNGGSGIFIFTRPLHSSGKENAFGEWMTQSVATL